MLRTSKFLGSAKWSDVSLQFRVEVAVGGARDCYSSLRPPKFVDDLRELARVIEPIFARRSPFFYNLPDHSEHVVDERPNQSSPRMLLI